tara:strand:+ start:6169 stop:6696 length:528 start_codon:yes stop_codon:yes gene_type:complete
MEIEEFVKKSEGKWLSMRSGHSLAFQQFEEIVSNIEISLLQRNDPKIESLIHDNELKKNTYIKPFIIKWNAETNWEGKIQNSNGNSIIIPFPKSKKDGFMIRSSGYAENIKVVTDYQFTDDGTLLLSTNYTETTANERIWFISENVRCRSSVLLSSKSKAILQTSFASEIRKLKS